MAPRVWLLVRDIVSRCRGRCFPGFHQERKTYVGPSSGQQDESHERDPVTCKCMHQMEATGADAGGVYLTEGSVEIQIH